jgi:hypothetical protein
MTTSRKTNEAAPAAGSRAKAGGKAKSRPADLQPQATGANRGSPAASVMKQFQKTKSESTGRS